jgi:DeoR/GlpR family transcriptional regulator of sugar metabolism
VAAADVKRTIDAVWRIESARLIAGLARFVRDVGLAEAAVKRHMISSAKRRILLADHSKVGLIRGKQHGDPSDIDLFITDTGLPDAQRRALAAAGLTVECV